MIRPATLRDTHGSQVQLSLTNRRGPPPASAHRVAFVYYDATRPPSVFNVAPEYLTLNQP